MESALFVGRVRHRRFTAPERSFSYPLSMLYLDLGELESVFEGRWLWSTSRPNVAWFRREDHHGDPRVPLDVAIRDLVSDRTGARPDGPIRLLTHLRYFGHCFNPVSFFYCFSGDGRTLETIVAEVTNTPWNERHLYVLPVQDGARGADSTVHEMRKAFHVSPFLGMDMDYRWRFGRPPAEDGAPLSVHMENHQAGARVFDASLSLTRRPASAFELGRVLTLRPLQTVGVVAAIYGQALRLFLRRAPFFAHPGSLSSRSS